MTIIRSFYFRNEQEIVAVKKFLHDIRVENKKPITKSSVTAEPEQIIPKERLVRIPTVEKIGISVEDFLAKHPVKNEIPEPQEKDWIGIVGELPNWMLDVINGNFPPPPEENTSVQNKVFDDKEFRDLCKTYQKTHDPELFKVARDIAERCGVEL